MGKRVDVSRSDPVVDIGQAALTGWRGRVARPLARPIARRTGLTQEQVEAILGLLLLAYAIYRVVRPALRAARS
jgi:hypothetical protein